MSKTAFPRVPCALCLAPCLYIFLSEPRSLYIENDITIQYHYYLLTSPVAQDMNARRQQEELLNKKETPVSTNNAVGVTTWKGGYSWIRF